MFPHTIQGKFYQYPYFRTFKPFLCFMSMSIYKLERTQLIMSDISTLWQFFSNPENLSAITPAYMNFRITSPISDSGINAGQIITYKVSPILNIPLSWMTEITDVEQHKHFVDEQKKGPYKLWQHKHVFEEKDGKTLMTDIVRYQLPLGLIGRLAHFLFVKRQLQNIFDYRHRKIEAMFNR